MFSFSYPAVFRPEPDCRFIVSFPDLRGANTDGKDKQEATEEAIDCLGSYIAEAIATKRTIPPPSALKRGQRLVPVPFWIAGKLALYSAMRQQRISNSELARRLGIRETVIRRMLDPDHATKPEKLQAALAELGQVLAVSVVAA
jgi:antitoxin HicB